MVRMCANPGRGGGATVGPVYHSLLTKRYLTSKVMPLLASLAVMLCTGMVVIVWSVMGGFLSHLIGSGRSLSGDVQIELPGAGFSRYDELRARLEKLPEVEATAAGISTQAMMVLPDGSRDLVAVRGIDGPTFAKVASFEQAIWWKPLTEPMRKDRKREDPRLVPEFAPFYTVTEKNGLTLTTPAADGSGPVAGAVLGIELTGVNLRHVEGYYTNLDGHGYPRLPSGKLGPQPSFLRGGNAITLHLLPMDKNGNPLTGSTQRLDLPVANEFQTGMYEVDRKTVLTRLDALQKVLRMDEAVKTAALPPPGTVVREPDGKERFAEPQETGVEPARVTTVYVRARGDVGNAQAVAMFKEKIENEVLQFEIEHPDATNGRALRVNSWRDLNRTFISAVEKELGLTLFLFGLISLVSVFLVLAIFWSMVAEKTKDIGILRAIGASRMGVAWVWVRYGLVIGVVGAIGGGVLSYLIVTNINEIHDWLGTALNIKVWDPKVYYFSEIPAKFKWFDATIVLVCGVLSSGIGAFVPAMRAARMDPVRALRFE